MICSLLVSADHLCLHHKNTLHLLHRYQVFLPLNHHPTRITTSTHPFPKHQSLQPPTLLPSYHPDFGTYTITILSNVPDSSQQSCVSQETINPPRLRLNYPRSLPRETSRTYGLASTHLVTDLVRNA